MGIIYSNAALLLDAKRTGVCFDKVLTIGHQSMYITSTQLNKLSKHYNIEVDISTFKDHKYIDKFFQVFLDTKEVKSLDYSDYQNCDIVHDMNEPVDSINKEKFDVVIDGGSIEHIFNFPIAIKNCMEMVKPGGHIFIFTMANNHMGHGFYQFSPELFYRIFQPENGFEICDVILEEHSFPGVELSLKNKCYSVMDPAKVKSRVGLVSKSPSLIMVHAKKIECKEIFAKYPIQSDYKMIYNEKHKKTAQPKEEKSIISFCRKIIKVIFRCLPSASKDYIQGKQQLHKNSFKNKGFYKRR